MTPIWKKCLAQFCLINLSMHQDPKNNWRVPFKTQFFARFTLVSLSIHPRSRRGAERIGQGEGRSSRPSNTALERSNLTGKIQFQESHAETERTKTADQIPVPSKRESSYIYVYSWTQREYVLCFPIFDLPPPRNFLPPGQSSFS